MSQDADNPFARHNKESARELHHIIFHKEIKGSCRLHCALNTLSVNGRQFVVANMGR